MLFEASIMAGLVVLAVLGAAQIMMLRENRKALERLARGDAARAMLARREATMSDAPFGAVDPLPSSVASRPTSVEVPPRSSRPKSRPHEPLQPPTPRSFRNYAEQARRPAPDSEVEPDSAPAVNVAPEPPDESPVDKRPTLLPPPSAPAEPEPSMVAAGLGERPSERRGAVSETWGVASETRGIAAAQAGDVRGARSERPPPHAPPRKATLLGIHGTPATTPPPPSVSPLRRRSPAQPATTPAPQPRLTPSLGPLPAPVPPPAHAEGAPSTVPMRRQGTLAPVALEREEREERDDRTSEPDDEPTRMAPRPPPEALGLAPASPDRPPQPRRIVATLASMPAVSPSSGRVAPPVAVISASLDDDDERSTLRPGDAPALR